jgi:twitching motility protein PilT
MTAEMVLSILNDELSERFKKEKEVDFSLELDGTRFRTNIFWGMGAVGVSMRVVPSEIPDFEKLGLPGLFHSFTDQKQGFILVTGPTGQGKSTTVAAMLEEINAKRNAHIVTIEDPVEYVIRSKKSIVLQREVGNDTNGFHQALRSCLRQDPNVVFVGEMRDLETISSALTIAETGHLVFSTLHTNSASQTIDRIIDVFPEGAKEQVRFQLAGVITAVVSQRLVPSIDGKSRVPAFEILIATPAVRNSIRESKTFMIDNIIQTSGEIGMVSLEKYLAGLVKKGVVSEETAVSYCLRPVELQSLLVNKRLI